MTRSTDQLSQWVGGALRGPAESLLFLTEVLPIVAVGTTVVHSARLEDGVVRVGRMYLRRVPRWIVFGCTVTDDWQEVPLGSSASQSIVDALKMPREFLAVLPEETTYSDVTDTGRPDLVLVGAGQQKRWRVDVFGHVAPEITSAAMFLKETVKSMLGPVQIK